eukprot:Em0014g283a
MLRFNICTNVPESGGRSCGDGGGGLVELDGRVVWGVQQRLYSYDQVNSKWDRMADGGGDLGARLAMCGDQLVLVGGWDGSVNSKKVKVFNEGKWSTMPEVIPDMLVGCECSCILSVSEGGMVVMGGLGVGGRDVNDVQVFDGKAKTWHKGPSLPLPVRSMSAVVHGDLVFVMGGWGMKRAVWCAKICDLTSAHACDTQQSIWVELPDVPHHYSSVCAVDGLLLAIGGGESIIGTNKTSAIYAFHSGDRKWVHVGDMPFQCDMVDTLLSGGGLLCVDGVSQQVFKMEGLSNICPITLNTNNGNERRFYEEAMTKGYVETSVTKCLILGAAGVGKTHLKHLLLKKDPPEQRISTGLADNPIRAVSSSMAGVGEQEDDWFPVEDGRALMKVVCGKIGVGHVSMATSLEEVVSSLPKITINMSSDGAGAGHSDSVPTGVNITMDTTKQSETSAIEELIDYINHPTDTEKRFGVKWIHLIDCGGQLQYHDILPLFIQNPGVTVFVLKLSEELSHQPTIEYYGADSRPISMPYQSYFSHEQILQHCLGAICSQDARPLIITVGTHRDAVGRCSESIEDKNEKLKALLGSGSFRFMYNGEGCKEVIFAVNGKVPQDEDRHVAKELRQKIISECPPSIKMPIAWFVLEVLLLKSSHDGILSLEECQGCAKRLHIEGDAFSAALHHLVHHNVFLHYPEVLPQTVFCDPQVVLTKVTELVEYHHKLLSSPDGGVAAMSDLVAFRDHGLLSVKLLKKFPKHYKDGLFTPHDLLQLLVSVGAIAVIRDGVYLMPALLHHLDSVEVSKYITDVSLIIHPRTQGCIPSGLFCCLVAHLLSPGNPSSWKVGMEGDKPLCLYRNCITFELEHSTELVTLVDMFYHIVVHVNKMSAACEIRHCVHSGIKSACSLLKWKDVQFKDAFKCEGGSCSSDPPHVADVCGNEWKCTKRCRLSGDLSKGQLMWFTKRCRLSGDLTLLTLFQLPYVVDGRNEQLKIVQRTATHYTELAMHLLDDVNLNITESLEMQFQRDPERIARDVYKKWISGTGRKPVSWQTLVGVLRDIQLNSLADEIENAVKHLAVG